VALTILNKQIFMRSKQLLLAMGISLGVALSASAQFPGFGGFGGGQNQNRQGNNNSSSTRQYNNSTQVGSATISSDPETGRIIVITDEDTSLHISQVISNLDIPKPQVLIKVVFLEVTYNNGYDIGIEGGFKNGTVGDGKYQGSVSGANAFGASGLANLVTTNVNAFNLPVAAFGTVPPGAGLYQVLGTDYQATLRAIATAGKTEVLSRPSILARNNQPATITVGQSVPLIASTRFDAVNGQINSVQYQSVGIILRVTPFISNDGLVEMVVSPEISALADQSQWVAIGGGALAPVINTRSADTVVVTPNGQTVIIGGLMQNNKTASESKIPFLGDIPLIGNLFKRQAKNNTKTELLIFLTPHIVEAPSQLLALSEKERAASVLPKKAFTDKDMDQFLNDLPKNPETKKGKK
jgi:general secretion pathway protein D